MVGIGDRAEDEGRLLLGTAIRGAPRQPRGGRGSFDDGDADGTLHGDKASPAVGNFEDLSFGTEAVVFELRRRWSFRGGESWGFCMGARRRSFGSLL